MQTHSDQHYQDEQALARLQSEGKLFYCDICGTIMTGRHCKLVCPNCKYIRDCSDP